MWKNTNIIPIEDLMGKDLLLFKFNCGLCQTETEILCYNFDINFFIRNADIPIKHNLGCPYCDKSNYHDFNLELDDNKLIIQVDSEGYIFEPTPVNQNSIYYSICKEDITENSIEWVLELDFFEDLLGINSYKEYLTSINDVKILINEEKNNTNKLFRKLIFSNVITVLETYIALSILNIVFHDRETLINIVEKYNIFGNEKIEIRNIFNKMESLKSEVLLNLQNKVFHNFNFVVPLLKKGFGIDITPYLGELIHFIEIRHDIIHRNGRDKENIEKFINVEDLENLIYQINLLVNFLEHQFTKIRNKSKISKANKPLL
ncbi:MAG: hypothetical protein KA270_05390 [Saprospiraceae bacterium]|nr:hypothetical protein [Saprospiraceae bacterium]MBP6566581.1 hypothetical protein [Saprospiraceae bacterium]